MAMSQIDTGYNLPKLKFGDIHLFSSMLGHTFCCSSIDQQAGTISAGNERRGAASGCISLAGHSLMFHQILSKIFQQSCGSLDATCAPQLVLQALWILTVGQVQVAHVLAFVFAELDSCTSPRGEIWDTLRKSFDIDASYHLMLGLIELLDLALPIDQTSTHIAWQERFVGDQRALQWPCVSMHQSSLRKIRKPK